MGSHYTILQYVPNSMSGERLNVGVIAFDEESVHCRTLHNWRRVSSFGGAEVKALRALVEEFTSQDLTPSQVRDAAESWMESLRLTAPRASVAPVDRLVDQMADLMLVDIAPQKRQYTKLTVVRFGRAALERAVQTKTDRTDLTVELSHPVPGLRVNHDVDLAVQNGRVLLVAQAVSFAQKSSKSIQRDVDATAWVLEDLGKSQTPPDLAVLVAPPLGGSNTAYEASRKLFRELQASVIPQAGIDTWANGAVAALKAS